MAVATSPLAITIQRFFRSRQANTMSGESSSSSEFSSGSGSDSNFSRDEDVRKFELFKAMSTCLAGWVLSGLGESKA